MKKIEEIKKLVNILNKASDAYYKYDNPIMSDRQFDEMYNKLESLEKETKIILNNSPTLHVGGEILPELKKVKHTKPMLSANKTKDISEIKKFVAKNQCVMSWKEDGLTIVLRYKNGNFVQAITRGQFGLIGEDVTHTIKTCSDVPMKIPYCVDMQVRGECLISYEEFNNINNNLAEPYKTPRNLASGTVRQLDSNIAKNRKLTYKAFELDQENILADKNKREAEKVLTVEESFDYLTECGFNVVEHVLVNEKNVEEMIMKFNPKNYNLPVDGLIFKYNDVIYGNSLGKTSKYPLDMIALKWTDDIYDTVLNNIEWTMGKTGSLCPTAIFEPVEIDGTMVEKASLHNVSVMKNILGNKPWIGQKIGVYKSNMIIPQLDWAEQFNENIKDFNILTIPNRCPICNGYTEIIKDNESEVLICTNPDCPGKLLGKISHAVSRNALNIDGLSDATIEKFISLGWLKSIFDIYSLEKYEKNMKALSGFGKKSVDKLLSSIEVSRKTELNRFINALSIPMIGNTASKAIAKYCDGNVEKFFAGMDENHPYINIEGIGIQRAEIMEDFWKKYKEEVKSLAKEFIFEEPESENKTANNLDGLNFVITGSLNEFENRDAAKFEIEKHGGKVVGSISSRTNFLVNNDVNSTSSKNTKAKSLGIPIISELELISIINSNVI